MFCAQCEDDGARQILGCGHSVCELCLAALQLATNECTVCYSTIMPADIVVMSDVLVVDALAPHEIALARDALDTRAAAWATREAALLVKQEALTTHTAAVVAKLDSWLDSIMQRSRARRDAVVKHVQDTATRREKSIVDDASAAKVQQQQLRSARNNLASMPRPAVRRMLEPVPACTALSQMAVSASSTTYLAMYTDRLPIPVVVLHPVCSFNVTFVYRHQHIEVQIHPLDEAGAPAPANNVSKVQYRHFNDPPKSYDTAFQMFIAVRSTFCGDMHFIVHTIDGRQLSRTQRVGTPRSDAVERKRPRPSDV